MGPREKGDITEGRVYDALLELRKAYPAFVQEVRQAPPSIDARGIDFLVKIGLPKGLSKRR